MQPKPQTSVCSQAAAALSPRSNLPHRYATAEFKGAGGRIADAVAAGSEKFNTMSFSLLFGL